MGYSMVKIDEVKTGQEEVNVIFRFDPETTRQPVAGPDGLAMVAVGARRGSYEAHGPF